MVFFGLGIVALLYVWRRTVIAARGSHVSPDCTSARSSHAHQLIEQIEGAEWMAKRSGAMLLPRASTSLQEDARQRLRGLRDKAGQP